KKCYIVVPQEFDRRVKDLKLGPVDATGVVDAFVAVVLSQLLADVSLLKVIKSASNKATKSISGIYFRIHVLFSAPSS
ncbi:hypothetical protein M8C21_010763, partial [Ambrosia artemisiifolia]